MDKYVYKITNLINNKIYIGQSIDYERRFTEHATRHTNYVSIINQAIRKYGKDNFNIEPLYYGPDYNAKEIYYIQFYNTLVPNGYNIALGGEEPPHLLNGKYSTSVLTYDMVTKIINELKTCDNVREVQDKYQEYVTPGQIVKINNGIAWRREEEAYPISTHYANIVRDEDILPIINEILTTTKILKQIGQEYGYCKSTIVNINQGNKDKYRFPEYEYPIRKQNLLTLEQVLEIIVLLEETNLPYKEIGDKYGHSDSTIRSINSGRSWKQENKGYPIRKNS